MLVIVIGTTGAVIGCGTARAPDSSLSPTPASVDTTAPTATPTEIRVTASPSASRVVEVRTVIEAQSIPFKTTMINDSTLAQGATKVRTQGVPGVLTLTYEVTLNDGVQTSKRLLRKVVTRAPVTKVILVGTKKPSCDPNYSGACVPIASDVDCAGGGGNGPAYVDGPVYVIGSDIYDLDRDGDGVGCE
jgi:resuscitation-promoting factor RpfB